MSIYDEKMLVMTNDNENKIYLSVEDTENGDLKYSEKLLNHLSNNYPEIEIII